MNRKKLIKDIENIKEYFPKLFYSVVEDKKLILGDIDICDSKGYYWNTFKIAILIPETYPYGSPTLHEISEIIPRNIDRHISNEGVCCVDIGHELLYWSNRGISIFEFIREKVYPFLANQLYYEKEGEYANGEYMHNDLGVRQFYKDRLNLVDTEIILDFLSRILSNNLPGRNDYCLCKSGEKYKNCHYEALNFLKAVGNEQVRKDIKLFEKLLLD